MKFYAAGVRGTAVVTDPAFARFGGDTTCFLFEHGKGETLLVDAGTGVRNAVARIRALKGTRKINLLLTHFHLDHLMGFPSIEFLYDPLWEIAIVAPEISDFRARETVDRILSPPVWPLTIDELSAKLDFYRLEQTLAPAGGKIGPFECRWCRIRHPGEAAAFRIENPATGKAIVIATDIEWDESSAETKSAFIDLCASPVPAEALVFDGHYTAEEYETHRGWGHSRWIDGVNIAREAGVRRLAITHHAPGNDDCMMDGIEREMKALMPAAECLRQGTVWEY